MCFYGLLSPEFCESSLVKARKPHRCDECRRQIEKGERYKKIIGKWDGEFQQWKQCEGCQDLIATIERIEVKHGCSWEESSPGIGALYESLPDCPEARATLCPMVITNA